MKRDYGIDLLRCILLFFGPLFHVGMLLVPTKTTVSVDSAMIYAWSSVLNPFRMEYYFAISGYFTFFLIKEKGLDYFKSSRKKNLYLPTLFALVSILPLTNFVANFYYVIPGYSAHHVWFIISLSIISIFCTFFAEKFVRFIEFIDRFSFKGVFALFLFLYSVCYIFYLFTYRIFDEGLVHEIVINILLLPCIYFVPFLFGAYLNKHVFKPMPIRILYKNVVVAITLYLIIYFIWSQLKGVNYDNNKELRLIGRLLILLASAFLMKYTFDLFRSLKLDNSRVLSFLVKGAMPFYLIHHIFVLFFTGVLMGYISSPSLFFFCVLGLTYIFSLIFTFLVLQWNFSRKLFGIKPKEQPCTETAQNYGEVILKGETVAK